MLTNLIGFIFLSIISCQSKKSQSNSTSKFFTDSIYSEHLNEYRKHNVYLPKGFDRDKNYSIIYGTDGNKNLENSSIKKNLDSLIENHIIKPIIYIGSHSNDKIADSTSVRDNDGNKIYLHYRNFEYVEQDYLELINPNLADRFKNHMLYFKDELIPQVEEKLNPNSTKKDRLFYGVSNGAGFGANLLNKYPNSIATYICYSTLGSYVEKNKWDKKITYPDLYLQFGSEERSFFKEEAKHLKAKYDELGSFCELKKFTGGHDYIKWNEEFVKTISKLLKT